MPPFPKVFQNPASFHRKGAIYNFDDPLQLVEGDFPGGLKDVDTYPLRHQGRYTSTPSRIGSSRPISTASGSTR